MTIVPASLWDNPHSSPYLLSKAVASMTRTFAALLLALAVPLAAAQPQPAPRTGTVTPVEA